MRSPPLLCLSLLLGWGLISCALAADKEFAAQGLLSLGGGVFLTFLVCAQVRHQAQILFVLDGLLGAALLVALSSLAAYGADRMPIAVGVFHDHQLFGAFLLLLIPISLAISVSPVALGRRLFAQVVFVTCQMALLASQARSAWIGEAVALLTFGSLLWRVRPRQPKGDLMWKSSRIQAQTAMSAAVILLAVAAFVVFFPDREAMSARVRTLAITVTRGRDDATRWRLSAWTGAERMIRAKPVLGWGIGSYPRFQSAFTGIGHPGPQVRSQGPTISDEAHDSYLQAWAETGLVGLILWLTVLCSFLAAGFRALRRLPTGGLEQRVLIGGMSALAGQMTDALASPAWQFGSVLLYLWVILGLMTALIFRSTATAAEPATERPDRAPTAPPIWWRVAQLVATLVLGWVLLRLLWQTAGVLPAPYL